MLVGGRFRAAPAFIPVSVQGCTGYIVRAMGSKGSYAYLRHLPECAGD
jgi:hypothetical protein